MEGPRFLLAIVLSIAVVIGVNLLFPPTPRPDGPPADSLPVDTVVEHLDSAPSTPGPADEDDVGVDPFAGLDTATAEREQPRATQVPTSMEPAAADTFWVQTPIARYAFAATGGALVSVELLNFESYTRDGPVQLVEPTDGALLDYGIRVGDRVVPFSRLSFQSSIAASDTLFVTEPTTFQLQATVNGATVAFDYAFDPESYLIALHGRVEGLGDDATLLMDFGPRLAVNEADSAEDLRALAYVVNARQEGIEAVQISKVESNRIEEGPLEWVALRNKYFLAAAIGPDAESAGFGGVIAEGAPGGAELVRATLPLARDGSYDLRLFFGPQEYSRLAAVGEELKDVNPYGWRIFRPIIRPLAEIITWLLTAGHGALGLGYGWVLILFGVAMRGLLWPLNAKAMRSQLKTMELQPRIKEIQTKYKEKPEQLQKEMMRLYKEEGFNPLGGCLPMLIPWPVLITLFFVFQNTIEFRGVGFLWLPDLSRPDPLYLLPVVLGLSLFALQFMNMRATGSDNPQQKMLMYFMPVMMTVIFLNFASGLNLYYAASNVASLPQQIQIIGERKRAKARIEAKKKDE
jgi:YidC/Oxa1 family membrane protein insertase